MNWLTEVINMMVATLKSRMVRIIVGWGIIFGLLCAYFGVQNILALLGVLFLLIVAFYFIVPGDNEEW